MPKKKHENTGTEAAPEKIESGESTPENPPSNIREPMWMGTAVAICITGWLIPGISHIVLGRWVRGLIFTASVMTMFGLGLMMQGRLYDITPEVPLHMFAFVADVGIGLPYILAQRLGYGVGVLEAVQPELRLRQHLPLGGRPLELPGRSGRLRYQPGTQTMILSHFTALLIFALIVSVVFALINKTQPMEQLKYGAFVFLSFLGVALVVGWLMFPFPF